MPTAVEIRSYAADPLAFLADLIIPAARGPARFVDVMAPHQRERFAALAPALLAVAAGQQPAIGRHWWEATKGASKDSDLAACLLWLLAFSHRPLTCQVGAADADQADELRKAAKLTLRLNPWLAGRVEVQNWKLLCRTTESEAEIIAADTAGSHGARPDVLILNELSHITKDEFAANLLDNASKVPFGLVVIATNAGFTGTMAWKWRELARTSPRWSFHTFDRPAPWLDPEEIEEAQRRNSIERFNRLFYGVWASGGGDALDPADINSAIIPHLRPLQGTTTPQNYGRGFPGFGPQPGQLTESNAPDSLAGLTLMAGLDLGIKHDHSAMVVLAANHAHSRVRLAWAQDFAPDRTTGQVDLEAVEQAVVDAHRCYRLQGVFYDPYQAALMAQRLQKRSVRMIERPFIGQSLNLMATVLLETFRSRRIDLYPHERLVADLRRLTIVEKSYGHKLESTRDADGHCDVATALAIVLPAAIDALNGPCLSGGVIRFAFHPADAPGPFSRSPSRSIFG